VVDGVVEDGVVVDGVVLGMQLGVGWDGVVVLDC